MTSLLKTFWSDGRMGLAAAVGLVVFTVLAWKDRYWGTPGRLHYTLVTLAALASIPFLHYWNLLGLT